MEVRQAAIAGGVNIRQRWRAIRDARANRQPAAYWAAKLRERSALYDGALTRRSREAAEPGDYRERGLAFVRA